MSQLQNFTTEKGLPYTITEWIICNVSILYQSLIIRVLPGVKMYICLLMLAKSNLERRDDSS